VVLGLTEAQMVCDYILGKGQSPSGFIEHFAKACFARFRPRRDLSRVGVANQNHLASEAETEEIAGCSSAPCLQRHGPRT